MRILIHCSLCTNQNLEQQIEKGEFRKTYIIVLNVIPIHLPPLRERKEDIPLLAVFLSIYSNRMHKYIKILQRQAMQTYILPLARMFENFLMLYNEPLYLQNITSFKEILDKVFQKHIFILH